MSKTKFNSKNNIDSCETGTPVLIYDVNKATFYKLFFCTIEFFIRPDF